MKNLFSLFFLFLSMSSPDVSQAAAVKIPEGRFSPLYGIEKDQKDFLVKSFLLDPTPVTVGAFKKFLKLHPEWSKERAGALYVDKDYLVNLATDGEKSPVVNVSWFAANAYCESKKGRLPSTLEWEYVAAASETKADASRDEVFVSKILEWYSKPETKKENKVVGSDRANLYGLHNLHGMIWEWTSDFNSIIMTSDNREDGNKLNGALCGAGSIGAKTKEDYAAFVRYSLRSSLQAPFTLNNLGFRCAYDY